MAEGLKEMSQFIQEGGVGRDSHPQFFRKRNELNGEYICLLNGPYSTSYPDKAEELGNAVTHFFSFGFRGTLQVKIERSF